VEVAGLPAAALTSVRLARSGPGWEVAITEPDNALTFAVGATDWIVAEPLDRHGDAVPVAASGGWLDDHTLRVEVIQERSGVLRWHAGSGGPALRRVLPPLRLWGVVS
jgi:hypothetical protein